MSEPGTDVLVLNSGSSSIKYVLFRRKDFAVRARGVVERIGESAPRHRHRVGDDPDDAHPVAAANHHDALALIVAALQTDGVRADSLAAVGHRVVHGGEAFSAPTLIDDGVLRTIRELGALAPLHNPANADGIEVARRCFPGVPHVAVFDTAFHATLPPQAFRYAVPERFYAEHAVRRYGFHGTSHQYVARETARRLGRAEADVNLVSLHLGNGASACAVRGGRSVDTSMGLTPLAGLVMGTRPGDIDPGVLLHLATTAGLGVKELERILNHESGLKGLCGASDMREVLRLRAAGDPAADLAVRLFCYRAAKQVGAYCAVLGRLDALVFTAGIGENQAEVRAEICEHLGGLGVRIDLALNQRPETHPAGIQAKDSRVAVMVVATREEVEIARQALARVMGAGDGPAGAR